MKKARKPKNGERSRVLARSAPAGHENGALAATARGLNASEDKLTLLLLLDTADHPAEPGGGGIAGQDDAAFLYARGDDSNSFPSAGKLLSMSCCICSRQM